MASIGEWFSLGPERSALVGWLVFSCGGCGTASWQDERVLGEDLFGIEIRGVAGSGLGSALSLGPTGLVVGAELSGTVHLYDLDGREQWCHELEPGRGIQVGWSSDGIWAWQRGAGFTSLSVTGELLNVEIETEATAVDLCPDGTFAKVYGAGAAVHCTESGVLWTDCAGSRCEVYRDEVRLGDSSPGSAVAWMDGQACWGDAQLEQADATGAYTCEDGRSLEGLDGEHLGSSMSEGRVAGQFSKWLVPARARVVDDAGGDVWAIERAAERSRVVVDGYGGRWAVGVAGAIGEGTHEGRVIILSESEGR